MQAQLDEKTEVVCKMEEEMSSLRSRIAVFKNEAESKEEQMEVLQVCKVTVITVIMN